MIIISIEDLIIMIANNVLVMTYKNAKTILFAGLIAAMILPFSMMMAEAATNDNVDDQAKKRVDLGAKFKNPEADEIMRELAPYIITKSHDVRNHTVEENVKMKALQEKLEKSNNEHKEKIIDKELQKDLKIGLDLVRETDIPLTMSARGIEYAIFRLAEPNTEYENKIADIMGDLPYKINYGEGLKRGACSTTQSDCDPEIGGIGIEVDNLNTTVDKSCSLSIPMKKDDVAGFLTAGHCFTTEYGLVYQPTYPDGFIGYSGPSWRSFDDNGECDCAWIIDWSSTPQQNGVFAFDGAYWVIGSTEFPENGDLAMLRGQHNNNGNWWESGAIVADDIKIVDGITTLNAMAFESPFQMGDSGGAVFYNGNYLGIAVAFGSLEPDGPNHVIFIPWQHVTENLSGLTL